MAHHSQDRMFKGMLDILVQLAKPQGDYVALIIKSLVVLHLKLPSF